MITKTSHVTGHKDMKKYAKISVKKQQQTSACQQSPTGLMSDNIL
jgi:hypothetical protein